VKIGKCENYTELVAEGETLKRRNIEGTSTTPGLSHVVAKYGNGAKNS
jgi:hypothetical protein